MPSVILGQPYASGAQQIISGNVFSGRAPEPVGGIQLFWISSGGQAYISLSGGGPVLSGGFMTINSGQMQLSGGYSSGKLDGFPMVPGAGYFIPKLAFQVSGNFNVYALCDQSASGVGRLYWEIF
jgi:hypothetical protein